MSIDVPTIRAGALEKLRGGGGHTIRGAVDEACDDIGLDDKEQRAFVTELLVAGLDRYEICKICHGTLLGGAERAFGTCGHCGQRGAKAS